MLLTVVIRAALGLVESIMYFFLECISRPAVVLCLWADTRLRCALQEAPRNSCYRRQPRLIMLIWSSAYHPWACPVDEKGDYQNTQSIHAAAYSARDPSRRDACVPASDCYEGDSLRSRTAKESVGKCNAGVAYQDDACQLDQTLLEAQHGTDLVTNVPDGLSR